MERRVPTFLGADVNDNTDYISTQIAQELETANFFDSGEDTSGKERARILRAWFRNPHTFWAETYQGPDDEEPVSRFEGIGLRLGEFPLALNALLKEIMGKVSKKPVEKTLTRGK